MLKFGDIGQKLSEDLLKSAIGYNAYIYFGLPQVRRAINPRYRDENVGQSLYFPYNNSVQFLFYQLINPQNTFTAHISPKRCCSCTKAVRISPSAILPSPS